jgi:outer membrane protein OmpA-like peptidoglycan-associated protein
MTSEQRLVETAGPQSKGRFLMASYELTGRVLAILAVSMALPITSGCAAKKVVVAVEVPVAPPSVAIIEAPPPPAPPEKIVLPGELEFENNSPYIKHTSETDDLLTQLADILQKNPHITKLRIEGHTDNVGKTTHNQWLSQQRAESVARWLANHDVDRERIVTVGFGDSRPLVDNATGEHRRMNRRTEFHVQELDGKPMDMDAKTAPESDDEKD